MSIISCPHCGRPISDRAIKCPYCKKNPHKSPVPRKQRKKLSKKSIIQIAAVSFSVVIIGIILFFVLRPDPILRAGKEYLAAAVRDSWMEKYPYTSSLLDGIICDGVGQNSFHMRIIDCMDDDFKDLCLKNVKYIRETNYNELLFERESTIQKQWNRQQCKEELDIEVDAPYFACAYAAIQDSWKADTVVVFFHEGHQMYEPILAVSFRNKKFFFNRGDGLTVNDMLAITQAGSNENVLNFLQDTKGLDTLPETAPLAILQRKVRNIRLNYDRIHKNKTGKESNEYEYVKRAAGVGLSYLEFINLNQLTNLNYTNK